MNAWSVVGNLSNAVAAALAAFSIYITLKEHREARENDITKTRAEQDLNWYNAVVLDDIIRSLNTYIDETEYALDKCRKTSNKDSMERELRMIYDDLKERHKSLVARVQLLKVFSLSLYQECDKPLQQILDWYSEVINEALDKKYLYNRWERDIQNERVEIIKKLYLFKGKFISGKD